MKLQISLIHELSLHKSMTSRPPFGLQSPFSDFHLPESHAMTWQARERPRHVPCLLRRLFSVFFVCIVAIALCAQANDRHTYDHAPNLLDTACGPHSSANSTSSPNAPSLVPNSPLLVNAPRRLEKQEEDAVVNFTVEENCINIHSSATGDHNNFSSSVSSSSPPSASSDASGGTSSSSSSAASAAKSMASGDHNAVLLLPGFASSQLYNWRFKDCFPFSYNLADRCVVVLVVLDNG
jgi:hypothetical protein